LQIFLLFFTWRHPRNVLISAALLDRIYRRIILRGKEMTNMASRFTKADMEQMAKYLTEIFPVLKSGHGARRGSQAYDMELRERTIRVEEELRHQRELMMEMFANMKTQFSYIEKRFEQVDKRFEDIRADMNRRFEQVDKKFSMMMCFTGIGLSLTTTFITTMMVIIIK